MNHDKLEQFVLDSRDDFDDLSPSPESWDKIQTNIKPVRRINWTATMLRIAAAVVIFVASYIFIDYNFYSNADAELQAEASLEDAYNNIPVLVEARAYYSSHILTMENELVNLAGQDSPITKDIKTEFEELDQVFTELKADLNDDAANEEIVEAMIQNYRIKVQILEEILFQLKSAEEHNTQDHENKKIVL